MEAKQFHKLILTLKLWRFNTVVLSQLVFLSSQGYYVCFLCFSLCCLICISCTSSMCCFPHRVILCAYSKQSCIAELRRRAGHRKILRLHFVIGCPLTHSPPMKMRWKTLFHKTSRTSMGVIPKQLNNKKNDKVVKLT